MEFEILSKDKNDNVLFQGKASQKEASFLLNIGINYLLAQGTYPLLKGASGSESVSGKLVDEDEEGFGLGAGNTIQ